MNITSVKGVYFSPTGGTRAVVELVSCRLAERFGVPYALQTYTLPQEREQWKLFEPGDLVVWGSPVYAGRIPNKTLDFVRSAMVGCGNKAVCVAVYGGRHYDNAVAEMCSVFQKGNLFPIAAAAVVSRHVFSNILGKGRPNATDIKSLTDFCNKVNLDGTGCLQVPGDAEPERYYTPLREEHTPAKFLKAQPLFDMSLCCHCGACAEKCPMGSISMTADGPRAIGICIKCQSCRFVCPKNAVRFDNEDFLSHIRMLEKNYDGLTPCEFWTL